MNERIEKLYIQTANETADGKEWAIGGLINAEKFAELIVRECLGIIENEASTYAESVWAHELVNDIKEHFGVEE